MYCNSWMIISLRLLLKCKVAGDLELIHLSLPRSIQPTPTDYSDAFNLQA